MADLFGRLAAQALGETPATRPLIAPMFAPGSAVDGDWAAASWERRPEEPVDPPGTARAPADRAERAPGPVIPARRAPLTSPGQAEQAGPPFSLPAQAPGDVSLERTVPDLAWAADPYAPAVPGAFGPEPAPFEPERRTIRALEETSLASQSAPGVVRPQVTLRNAPAEALRQDDTELEHLQGTAAPTIRVTIGRIEVRAIAPTAPAPAAPVRPAPRLSLSLDDYLKQRREGRP